MERSRTVRTMPVLGRIVATPLSESRCVRVARHPLTRVPAGEPDMAGLKPIAGRLLPHEHGRQIPEFGFHFSGIGYSIRDFLAKELAIPLAKPVNGHLERSL
jgi:hypothetical protein